MVLGFLEITALREQSSSCSYSSSNGESCAGGTLMVAKSWKSEAKKCPREKVTRVSSHCSWVWLAALTFFAQFLSGPRLLFSLGEIKDLHGANSHTDIHILAYTQYTLAQEEMDG